MIDAKTQARFWSQVVKPQQRGACWLWDGPMGENGHGYFTYQSKPIGAYRIAYIIAYGEIPERLIICHKCNENQCVNPKHLYAGTQQDNANDRKETGRRWMYRKEMTLKQFRKEMVSVRQAQIRLGLGAVELRMLDASGALPVYRTPVATWAYLQSDIDDFAKSQTTGQVILPED